MIVKGFKAFNSDFTNRYGMKFSLNKTYFSKEKISFGNNGNGFHMCERLEDTFRYFDTENEEIKFAEVLGFGKIVCNNDEYYGYYDMYACEKIRILRLLERKEIIENLYSLISNNPINRNRVCRFLDGYKLEQNEINFVIDTLYENDKYNIDIYKKILLKK